MIRARYIRSAWVSLSMVLMLLVVLAWTATATAFAPDGSGTLTIPPSSVSAGQSGVTLLFTYTAGTAGTQSGAVTMTVPPSWTAPSSAATAPGYSTATAGSVSVSGQTITVSGVTLAGGQTLTIRYGDQTGGGLGVTVQPTPGVASFTANDASTAAGTLTPLVASPAVTVFAADGSGTLTIPSPNVSAGQGGVTLPMTFTAGTGGMSNGTVSVTVSSSWSTPSTVPTFGGYSTSTMGTVTVSGPTLTVSGVTLTAGQTFTINLGDRSGGGPGATAYTAGQSTFFTTERSTGGGTLTPLGVQPTVTINPVTYAPDGSGTLTPSTVNVSAGQSGLTLTFTYRNTGATNGGAVTMTVPDGWSVPSTSNTAAGYTKSTIGTMTVSGQTITVSGVTIFAGQSFLITYGDRSGGGPGATAPTTPGGAAFAAQEKSKASGTLTALAASPSATVYAADGSGTLTLPATNLSAGQAGLTLAFTYTAAAGGTSGGAIAVPVPAGWSAPSTVATAAGYTTASAGTVSVAGQTITVSGVTLISGQTLTITYGDRSGTGPGATASTTPGTATFAAQEKSTTGGTLAALATPPNASIYAADGSGTLTLPATNVSAGQAGLTLIFTYTAAAGGTNGGAITLPVPVGWSAPNTVATAGGYTTASTGTVSVAGQTITVSSVTLAAGQTLTITYGDRSGGGPGATPTVGTATFAAQAKSMAGGTLTAMAAPPSATVYAADGSGTLTLPATNVSAGQAGLTLAFTYTAAAGGTSGGAITVPVPAGWSAPSTVATAGGYTTASTGTVSVAGQTITVSGVTLTAAQTLTITYGDRIGGGPGATPTAGTATFAAQEKSTTGGTLAALATSPSATVYSADGTGTLTLPATNVSAGQAGLTLAFTYTAAADGTSGGAITVPVPAGWSAPSTVATAAGYTTASTGTLSVAGQTITVSGVTLISGQTLTITYGNKIGGGPGATPTAGTATFAAQEKSTTGGTLTALATSPSATVYAPDGSGTLMLPATNVSAGQAGLTLAFTYTAAAGGTSGGAITVPVPAGWSAPSTVATAGGYTTVSVGTLSVAGQTITVSGVTLISGQTLAITYGAKGGGGPGATASTTPGTATFAAQEKSMAGGTLTALATPPSATIYAADGSGTLTLPATNVSAGQAGLTLAFTYMAAAGGTSGGAITVPVPAGWSAPSTVATAGGYTTVSAGTLSVAGQTITVSGVTLISGQTLTITYGNRSGGGPGATASTTPGTATFVAQEKSTAGGTLTALVAPPSATIYVLDGSGTLTLPATNVSAGQTGLTLAFTYTAAAGGTNSGAITVLVPTGWSAPSTVATIAGYTTASMGTVSVAGQTITVSGVTLAAAQTLTITYGDRSGGGPGATASTSPGIAAFSAQEKSMAGGTLTALATSPSAAIYDADGSGTVALPITSAWTGQTGLTLPFTYPAGAAGMKAGAVTVTVPTGWSAPSTVATVAGYTTATIGTVTVSGQTITVTGVTLAAAQTLTITYGNRSGGGPGAVSTTAVGPSPFAVRQMSTAGGVLASLGSGSPVVDVRSPATLTVAKGASARPGGNLNLASTSAGAVTWTSLDYKLLSDTNWTRQPTTGSYVGGVATIPWQVPATPGIYQIQVNVQDAQGSAAVSSVLQVFLPELPVITIQRDAITGAATLSWTPSSSSTVTYQIYKVTTDTATWLGTFNQLRLTPSDFVLSNGVMTYTDLFVQSGATKLTYFYWVKAVDSSGLENISQVVQLTP